MYQAWHSPEAGDFWWDGFLRANPCGQYQQSSLWAEFKAGEGWQHHRVVVTDDSGIAGGYQLLWKKKGPLKMGYVSKGPVLRAADVTLATGLRARLAQSARELGLTALIAQLPDETPIAPPTGNASGFLRSNPPR